MKDSMIEADRFVPMEELTHRLGTSRFGVYRAAKALPGFPRLCRMNGKTGALESELRRFLASLPGIKRKSAINEGQSA